jgi:hypothetical protein
MVVLLGELMVVVEPLTWKRADGAVGRELVLVDTKPELLATAEESGEATIVPDVPLERRIAEVIVVRIIEAEACLTIAVGESISKI